MTWPRSDRRTVDPPNQGNPTPPTLVACHGASLCSFGLRPSNGGDGA